MIQTSLRRTSLVSASAVLVGVAIAGCTGGSSPSSNSAPDTSAGGSGGSASSALSTVPVSGAASPSASCSTSSSGSSSATTANPAAKIPNAGYVYAVNQGDNNGGSVSILKPGSTSATTIAIPNYPGDVTIAPAGTPNAGYAYIQNGGLSSGDAQIFVIAPGASTATAITVGAGNGAPVIAPPGTSNAGTVYAVNAGSDSEPASVSVLNSSSTAVSATIPLVGSGSGTVYTASNTVIAPAGTPNAGTLYVVTGDKGLGQLNVLTPNGASPTTIPVGQEDTSNGGSADIVVSPAGTPNAGSVYVINGDGSMNVVNPGSSASAAKVQIGETVRVVAIAPAGTPNAGTLYVLRGNEAPDASLEILAPGATAATTIKITSQTKNNVDSLPDDLAIAPAGVPNAGTVYFTYGKSLAVLAPGTITPVSSLIGADPNSSLQDSVAVAPAGTPSAGAVYISGNDNIVRELKPCSSTMTLYPNPGYGATAIAPVGAPNAGAIYTIGQKRGDNTNPADLLSYLPIGATSGTLIEGIGSATGLIDTIKIAGTPITGSNTDE